MTEPDIVDALDDVLDDDLAHRLEQSLRAAHRRAREALATPLYDALEWPQDRATYEEYLRGFLRWIPQQSDAEAWQVSSPGDRNAREVSDRMAHFYWLVDQPGDDGVVIGQEQGPFRDWLTRFARRWGEFLDRPESISPEILDSFLTDAPEYTIEESLMADGRPNSPSGWRTFNQFFAREVNPGLRPIADPVDNRTVVSPADCSFQHTYDIGADSTVPAVRVKSHAYGAVGDLLADSEFGEAFAGGTFVHYMLPPSAYHRYHVPVSGTVLESTVVPGRVFLQVELNEGRLESLDSSASGYEFSQARGVVVLDTRGDAAGDVGLVAVVPVGMSHVASVNLTTEVGRHLAKGEEFGYFQFGGSDIIVLLQAGVAADVDTTSGPRLTGSVIARCR